MRMHVTRFYTRSHQLLSLSLFLDPRHGHTLPFTPCAEQREEVAEVEEDDDEVRSAEDVRCA